MPLYLLNSGSVVSELEVDGITMPLTFSVADMKQPDKRRTSSSKTIKLKGTANNMRILKNVYNLTGANLDAQILQYTFDPRVRVECLYEENGVVLFDGLFQVLRATKKEDVYEFECVMFSNIANIFNKLKDITIADLDWSEYNHLLDKDTIRKSWDESVIVDNIETSNFTSGIPDGFGYIYSWFDLGLDYVSGIPVRQKTNQLTLGVYFREILSKVMEYVGEDYTFTLNDTELFRRLVMFNEGGEIPNITAAEIALREVERTDVVGYESDYPVLNTINPLDATGNYNTSVNINYSTLLGRFTTGVSQDDLNQVMPLGSEIRYIKIAKTGVYNINLFGEFFLSLVGYEFTDIEWNRQFENLAIRVLKNGALLKSYGLGSTLTIEPTKQEALISYNLSDEFFLNEGDEIKIELTYSAKHSIRYDQNVDKPERVTLTIDSKTEDQNINITSIEDDIQDGSNVLMTRFLAQMKCSDWMRSFMRMFNLYQVERDGGILFIPAKDYYKSTNIGDTDNWSEYLDYSEEIEIEPPNRIKGKFYEMAFSPESDFYNEKYLDEFGTYYGNKIYEISNTWQEGTNKIELGFAQSVPVQQPASSVIMPTIYKEKNGEVEPYKGKAPRIFFYNGIINVPQDEACSIHPSNGEWEFADTGTPLFIGDTNGWAYPSFHHTLDLDSPSFDLVFEIPKRIFYSTSIFTSSNLWSTYWEKFIQEITSSDAKIFTAYFKLSRKLIKDLDFSRLKNVNGVLYRLNVVEDYIANENITVKCELIKIIKGDGNVVQTIDNIPKLPDSKEYNLSGGEDDDGTGTGITYGGVSSEKISNVIYG